MSCHCSSVDPFKTHLFNSDLIITIIIIVIYNIKYSLHLSLESFFKKLYLFKGDGGKTL